MRLTPIIGALVCMGLASAAAAADFGGSLKDDYSAPAGHNWTGLYIGGNVGHAWGDASFGDITWHTIGIGPQLTLDKAHETFPGGDLSVDGWFGGGHVGYSAHVGRFVFGIETDFQFGDMGDRATIEGTLPDDPLEGFWWPNELAGQDISATSSFDVNYFASIRARLGLPMGRVLPYVTGGFAWADVDVDTAVTIDDFKESRSSSDTHRGWVLGGGIEVALSDNWTVRGEYLYYDLGKERYSHSYEHPDNFHHTVSSTVDLTFQTVRVGASYRFGP